MDTDLLLVKDNENTFMLRAGRKYITKTQARIYTNISNTHIYTYKHALT